MCLGTGLEGFRVDAAAYVPEVGTWLTQSACFRGVPPAL